MQKIWPTATPTNSSSAPSTPIHLATALHYNADELATYDTRLAQAATLSGLTVIPTRA